MKNRSRINRRSGYTLIEVIVTIGVLAVAAIGLSFMATLLYVAAHFIMRFW